MSQFFADTVYWGALFNQRDQWHHQALTFSHTLTRADQIWTSDAVLTEVLTMFSGAGEYLRRGAARRVRALLSSPNVVLIPATHELFLEGFSLYEARPDKGYSLTDCMSMQIMRREGLTEVLTNDHHFTQEGFQILL